MCTQVWVLTIIISNELAQDARKFSKIEHLLYREAGGALGNTREVH